MYINLITIDLCPSQNGGGVTPSGTLTIEHNGEYNVYSYASASVDVHPSVSLSETYLSNGSYTITGEFNGGMVTVNVPSPQFVTESLSVSANGTYSPGEGVDGYSQVVVDVPQSVTGYTDKDITEKNYDITNLNNSASFVSNYAFIFNGTIQTVNLPYATSTGMSAFYGCNSLSQVNLPMCEYTDANTFGTCYRLTQVSLPVCSYIDGFAFNYCTSLSQVSLPMCSFIGYGAFQYCSSLSIITIGYSSVCSLYASNAFNGTPIKSGTGSIYVPASLVDAYKSASNWSSFSSQIFPISE